MPKPQGTYLRIQERDRFSHMAEQSRHSVATARSRDLEEFYKALDQQSGAHLERWLGSMAALVDKLKNQKPLSDEDRYREVLSKGIGEIRKVFEKVQDTRQLEGRLSVPLRPVLHAPVVPATDSFLALAIALCQIFEVLVRLRKRE